MTPTARQLAVLRLIATHQRRHGDWPTLRAMMHQLGLASLNGVVCHLKALEAKGLAQGSSLTPAGWAALGLLPPANVEQTLAAVLAGDTEARERAGRHLEAVAGL